jgi:hypothetical protein
MLKPKSEKISAGAVPILSDDAVRINAGSFIIDNAWVSFSGTMFKIRDYIASVVVGNRLRFFKDRNYAVYLLICLDPNNGITVVEGRHVKFTTLSAVPPPESFSFLPLIGVVLIQDGTRDIIYGFKPINDENIIYFSGTGNIVDRNQKGIPGDDSIITGETGMIGITGLRGFRGTSGYEGVTGYPGPTVGTRAGMTGLIGMTGINWDIYMPFEILE